MSYSYSKLDLFHKCKHKFKLKYIDKVEVEFKNTPTFEKGKFQHAILEKYPDVPVFDFKFHDVKIKKDQYIQYIHNLIKNDKIISFLFKNDVLLWRERQFFIDHDLKEIKIEEELEEKELKKKLYDLSLFNGIVDYIGCYKQILLLVDWKSGSTTKYSNLDQLRFYCLWIFANFPTINKIKICLIYLEQNHYVDEIITRDQIDQIKNKYFDLVSEIESEVEFKKNISEECQRCEDFKQCNPYKIELRKGTK